MKELDLEIIKDELIRSCINKDPKSFIPFLLSGNVTTGMPNKVSFYIFFKQMVNCAFENSKGIISHKIEHPGWIEDKNVVHYNFYDSIYKYSRLSIEVKETEQYIHLDTLPF